MFIVTVSFATPIERISDGIRQRDVAETDPISARRACVNVEISVPVERVEGWLRVRHNGGAMYHLQATRDGPKRLWARHMTAGLDVLVVGRADDRVASTCVLSRDGDCIVVVDPGSPRSPT